MKKNLVFLQSISSFEDTFLKIVRYSHQFCYLAGGGIHNQSATLNANMTLVGVGGGAGVSFLDVTCMAK